MWGLSLSTGQLISDSPLEYHSKAWRELPTSWAVASKPWCSVTSQRELNKEEGKKKNKTTFTLSLIGRTVLSWRACEERFFWIKFSFPNYKKTQTYKMAEDRTHPPCNSASNTKQVFLFKFKPRYHLNWWGNGKWGRWSGRRPDV